MCGKKKKPKPMEQPKVVERDLKKEQEEAAAKAAQEAAVKANEEAAAARRAKGKMMSARGVKGAANTVAAGAQAGAKKLGG